MGINMNGKENIDMRRQWGKQRLSFKLMEMGVVQVCKKRRPVNYSLPLPSLIFWNLPVWCQPIKMPLGAT